MFIMWAERQTNERKQNRKYPCVGTDLNHGNKHTLVPYAVNGHARVNHINRKPVVISYIKSLDMFLLLPLNARHLKKREWGRSPLNVISGISVWRIWSILWSQFYEILQKQRCNQCFRNLKHNIRLQLSVHTIIRFHYGSWINMTRRLIISQEEERQVRKCMSSLLTVIVNDGLKENVLTEKCSPSWMHLFSFYLCTDSTAWWSLLHPRLPLLHLRVHQIV